MNQELTNNPFNPLTPAKTFDEIKVSLASPERILSWSFGEIKKARNHQLPYVQARAGRPVLRAYLWPDQRLRMPVRQI